MESLNDSTHIELLELNAQNDRKSTREDAQEQQNTPWRVITKRDGYKKVDSLNCIRGKRLPSNLRNGSSMYIDGTTSLQIIRNYAQKIRKEYKKQNKKQKDSNNYL